MTLAAAVDALQRDLLDANGPRISTMRNYSFAIVVYAPTAEYELRRRAADLTAELIAGGWRVRSIDLHGLLLDRVRGLGDRVVTRLIDSEKDLAAIDRDRALRVLRDRLARHIEGPDGLAADVARIVDEVVADTPDRGERTLILLGRAGALYPFFRCSALLKHLDGRTHRAQVVVLYPGTHPDDGGLSFMGVLPPDRDYRPRIYA